MAKKDFVSAAQVAALNILLARRTAGPLARTFERTEVRGALVLHGVTGDRCPVYRATCKYLGCGRYTDIVCDGISDAADRATAEATARDRGWAQSVFDQHWLCDEHA